MNNVVRTWSWDGFKITLFSDFTYEINNGGRLRRVNLGKWYNCIDQAWQHIENDIKDGYYPYDSKKARRGR